jgi:hypothetical protein
MINIISKQCITCNDKIPTFNFKNNKIASYCGDCKLTDMIDVKNKKCITCNNKQPMFNFKNEKKALYCGDCKLTDMINIKNKKCITCNNKKPIFNFKNEKKALYCGDCKLTDMIIIKNKKCQLCNLDWPENKYDNMCSRCYYYTNPNSILTRNYKSKENQIISDLNNVMINDKLMLNKHLIQMPGGLIQLNNHNIIIEIDENQYNSYDYSSNNKRLIEIFKYLDNSILTIIRFNPNAYKLDNKKIKSPFRITKSDGKLNIINQKEYNLRLNKLIEIINTNINTTPDSKINVIHLFYDK